jgi:hypothetical protein
MKMRKRKRDIYAQYAFGFRVEALLGDLAEAAELLKEALDAMNDMDSGDTATTEHDPLPQG